NIQFTVPLAEAEKQIRAISKNAKVSIIGHLCIDNAMKREPVNPDTELTIRQDLKINEKNEYVFVSGTSQSIGKDSGLVKALLQELSTGHYPNLSLRMGIHPGVGQKEQYLKDLLEVCEKYPTLSDQFKIILPPTMEQEVDSLNNNQSQF